MNFDELTPEQQEKAKACKTPEDILVLAKEEGYELNDAELDSLAGGLSNWFCNHVECITWNGTDKPYCEFRQD